MTRWQRPPGPLNVWKVVNGYERLADGSQKQVKFSIQDIPNEDNRRKEVCDLLIAHYLPCEPCCKSVNLSEDSDGIDDYKRNFEFAMDHDISVGCYKLDSDGKIEELVGANVLFVMTDESFKDLQKLRTTFKSNNFLKCWRLLDKLSANADPFEIFQVDKYIGSISLCVNPKYKGQNLGYHMLNARNAIGKKYGIEATSTVFSAIASQRQAQRARFEVHSSIAYEDFIDDKGNPEYPINIESRFAKLMMKRLPQ